MKKVFIFTIATLSIISLEAQPPQGGGGGRPDGPPRGEMRQRPSGNTEEKLTLEVFPEIPNLSLEQREKVGSILTKEMKDVSKQMKKKHELMPRKGEQPNEKDSEKNKEKALKIDKKIESIKEKSNKKVKKQLSDEQYQAFIEKRNDFKFKQHRGDFRMRNRNSESERPQQPPQDGGEDMDNMFQ